jgi:hypothetical protein
MALINARPKWWQLYLIFPLLVALFILERRLNLSAGGHQTLQIGILLLVYGLVHLWLKANSKALANMEQKQFRETVIISRIPPRQLPERNRRPMFQFPDAEIKGALSDTFEMEIIDAEFIPMGESADELKKE